MMEKRGLTLTQIAALAGALETVVHDWTAGVLLNDLLGVGRLASARGFSLRELLLDFALPEAPESVVVREVRSEARAGCGKVLARRNDVNQSGLPGRWLVVDDSREDAKDLIRAVENLGARADWAPDLKSAEELLCTHACEMV